MQRIILALAVLQLAGPVAAETAYVTDILQLDMYATQAMTGGAILKLRSGDEMEVLERDGRYARVSAKGSQGWVKSLYLVTEEPARTRVNKLEKSNAGLQGSVDKLRAELAAEQARVTSLSESQSGGADRLAAAEAQLQALQQENERLQQKLQTYVGSVPLNWLLISALIALVGGAVSGWYVIDRRSRARHGGYRVY